MNQNAPALAQLAAMKARGQLNDDEFKAAKAAILNEGGKTVYRATATPQEKFVCTDTTTRRGSGLGAAIVIQPDWHDADVCNIGIAHSVLSIIICGGATVYALHLFVAGANLMRLMYLNDEVIIQYLAIVNGF